MRKMFLVLGMGFAGSFYAQTEITYGVKAGMNISSLSPVKGTHDNMVSYAFTDEGNVKGAYAGGFVNFSFNKYIGLQPELYFSMQGGKQFNRIDVNSIYENGIIWLLPVGKVKYQFYYVNFPVLLEVKPFNNFGILIGPQISYNISKNADYSKAQLNPNNYEWAKDIMDAPSITYQFPKLSNFDLSATIGLQYIVFQHLKIEARYNFSIIPQYDENRDYIITWGNYFNTNFKGWKNRVLQFGVGYVFKKDFYTM